MAKRRCQVLCGLPRRLPGRQLRAYGEGGYCVSMTMSNASHEGFSRFVAETGRSLQRYVRRLVGSPAAAEDIKQDRKRVVEGKRGSVGGDPGGRRCMKKNINNNHTTEHT